MKTPSDGGELRELAILEALEEDPEARQADLADRLGVAVGTVNWLVKRLASKGLLKVKRMGRWRWRYLLTPKGIREKARLAQQYVRVSMNLYRSTRENARGLLTEVKRSGATAVRIEGPPENDLVDVCRLTCLEEGITAVGDDVKELPVLRIVDRSVTLEWPEGGARDG